MNSKNYWLSVHGFDHKLLVLCDCSDTEHQLLLTYFDDEDPTDQFIYIQFHLSDRGFWSRLWAGIRYIFGYTCQYGHWDEVLINPKTAFLLKEFIDDFLRETADNGD